MWEPLPGVSADVVDPTLVGKMIAKFAAYQLPTLPGEQLRAIAEVGAYLAEFDLHPNGPLYIGSPDRLAEVPSLSSLQTDTGGTELGGFAYTSTLIRLAVVDNRDKERSQLEQVIAEREGFVDLPRDERLAAYAVHELTHLALRPRHICLITEDDHQRSWGHGYCPWSPYGLTDRAPIRHSFFDEGMASLVEAIYVWRKHPEIADRKEAEVRERPDAKYTIPLRYLYRDSYQMHAAHGIELLVSVIPELWPLLIRGPHRIGNVAAQVYSLLTNLDHRLERLFGEDTTQAYAHHLALIQSVVGR